MKVAVVGSRTFNDYYMMMDCLDVLKIAEIVSGGAKGADSLAERYANERSIPLTVFKPEWDRYGKGAGFRRNATIVDHADLVVAFWDGSSKGTQHSINYAKARNKEVIIIQYD